jgi:hypothetical protein
VDPLLGQLGDNGGSTDTMALGAGSPALDFAGACGLTTDQRGLARPSGGACDSGAFEVQVPPPAACRLEVSGAADRLKALVTCDAAAALSLGGVATIKPKQKGKSHGGSKGRASAKKKPKPKTVALTPATGAASAGAVVTLALKLPARALRAVKAGRRVSLALTLTATTAAGATSTATANLAKLKKPQPKKKKKKH